MFTMGQALSSNKPVQMEPHAQVFEAVENGRLWRLQYFHDKFPDFCRLTKNGKSLLHYAVSCHQIKCAKFLLESGVDVNCCDTYNNTPLLEVVQANYKSISEMHEVIQLLVQSKANINATNSLKRTALLKSIIIFHHDVSNVLLKLGADTNIADIDGLLPIHVCATYSSLPLLKEVLDHGANINAQDKKGRTALYFAILSGHQCIVDELIQRKCDLNLGSSLGFPLQTAIVKGKVDAVRALLFHGVDVQCKITEHRQTLSKAKDYVNLAMIVLHNDHIAFRHAQLQNLPNNVGLDQATQRLEKSWLVLNIILQAYGNEINIAKNVLIKMRKPVIFEKMPDNPMSRKLRQVCKRIAFMHEMSKTHSSAQLDGMPKVDNVVDKTSLQNICRMEVRKLVMKERTNVIYAVEKLDVSVIVKDILLLKDIPLQFYPN